MLDMAWVRDNLSAVETALRNRGTQAGLEDFRRLDGERRAALRETEALKARRNTASATGSRRSTPASPRPRRRSRRSS